MSPQSLLERVGLAPDLVDRYPHEFSGGQRQRIAIARALAASPSLLIGDEPISALDASAQAQVAGLMRSLAVESGAGLLFISHDLSVVRLIADRIAVMYLGKIVETGPTRQVWANPQHPYTQALLAAIPEPDGLGTLPAELPGDVPNPAAPPPGCRFTPRCPHVMDVCRSQEPMQLNGVACWLYDPVRAVALLNDFVEDLKGVMGSGNPRRQGKPAGRVAVRVVGAWGGCAGAAAVA